MRVLFPFDPLENMEADGPFKEEYLLLKEMGVECSLFDYDSLGFGEFRPRPKFEDGDVVLYRGWMLNPSLYEKLANLVRKSGGDMLTSPIEFRGSHHLPGWYGSVREFTPETIFFQSEENVVSGAERSGWGKFFVKDYVKSNYGERGSIANSPSEVQEIITLIREHRGEIEGGIALRKVEDLQPETEVRYFVFNGKPYSPTGVIPNIVNEVASRHKVPFYSVDIIQRSDGELRLIEIGDGQVSDRKSWDAGVFCKALAENA